VAGGSCAFGFTTACVIPWLLSCQLSVMAGVSVVVLLGGFCAADCKEPKRLFSMDFTLAQHTCSLMFRYQVTTYELGIDRITFA
jgi:hypothetical protein